MLKAPQLASDVAPGPDQSLDTPPPRLHSSGFTAVNDEVNKLPPIRPQEPPRQWRLGRSSPGDTITVSTSIPSHGWRPDDRLASANADSPHQSDDPTSKRKRLESEGGQQQTSGAHGDRTSPSEKRHYSNMIDSAIDLTSPDTEAVRHQPEPVRTSPDLSPVSNGNRGTPPPEVSSKASAELAKSAMQWVKQTEPVPADRHETTSQHSPIDASGERDETPELVDGDALDDRPDTKKRKRNFTNRTKTGCHTCRGRKKKCDEAKPKCMACERGNFVCLGYGIKPPADAKRLSKTRQLHLQPSVKLMSETHGSVPPPEWPRENPYSHWGLQLAPEHPPEPRHMGHKEPPPEHGWSNKAPPPPPLHVPPAPVHASFYHDRPPQQTFNPLPPPPPPPTRPSYNPPHYPMQYASRLPPPPPPPPPQSEPWAQYPSMIPFSQLSRPMSSMVSVHSGSSGSGEAENHMIPPHHLIEKDKMLRGLPFAHYKDPQLLDERKWCTQALNQYNDAANPDKNYSLSSRAEFMQRVLNPRKRTQSSKEQENHWGPEGEVGALTIIEVPFKCDYGYHVHIGKESVISADCYFQDGGGIHIGDRVVIAPNVTLLTITASVDPKLRKGSEGLLKARTISVSDDVFIGAKAVVLPGVTIGKGAVVGANSVVTRVRLSISPLLSCFTFANWCHRASQRTLSLPATLPNTSAASRGMQISITIPSSSSRRRRPFARWRPTATRVGNRGVCIAPFNWRSRRDFWLTTFNCRSSAVVMNCDDDEGMLSLRAGFATQRICNHWPLLVVSFWYISIEDSMSIVVLRRRCVVLFPR